MYKNKKNFIFNKKMVLKKVEYDEKDIENIIDILKQRDKEWDESIKSLPLSDEICTDLLRSYLAPSKKYKNPNIPYLHACVHPEPCKKHEKVRVMKTRKWCSGSGVNYGTPEFDNLAREIYDKYGQAEEERIKRMQEADPKIKEKMEEEVKFLEDMQKKVMDLPTTIFEIEKTLNDEDLELKERLNSLIMDDKDSKLRELENISQNLQSEKVRADVGKTILKTIQSSVLVVKKELRENKKSKLDNVQKNMDRSIDKMEPLLRQLNKRIKKLEKKIENIDQKQDQVLDGIENIQERQALQEYVDVWYNNKLQIVKKIALAPLKALNIIVWKPAKYAFWTFFGRYFYLIWGLLMLLLVLICSITAITAIKYYYPDIIEHIYAILIPLWGACIKSGSLLAQTLKPWFGDSTILVLTTAKQGISKVSKFLWDSTIGLFISIFKAVMDSTGGFFASTLDTATKWFKW
jgi:hypothetical protein